MLKIFEYMEKMTQEKKATLVEVTSEARTFNGFDLSPKECDISVILPSKVSKADVFYIAAEYVEDGGDWIDMTDIKEDIVVTIQYFPDQYEHQVVIWDGDQIHLIKRCSSVRYIRELLKEDGFTKVTLKN